MPCWKEDNKKIKIFHNFINSDYLSYKNDNNEKLEGFRCIYQDIGGGRLDEVQMGYFSEGQLVALYD